MREKKTRLKCLLWESMTSFTKRVKYSISAIYVCPHIPSPSLCSSFLLCQQPSMWMYSEIVYRVFLLVGYEMRGNIQGISQWKRNEVFLLHRIGRVRWSLLSFPRLDIFIWAFSLLVDFIHNYLDISNLPICAQTRFYFQTKLTWLFPYLVLQTASGADCTRSSCVGGRFLIRCGTHPAYSQQGVKWSR